jgi:uncharacterized protein (TIGR02001 family)
MIIFSVEILAETDISLSVTSDYLYHGISQTNSSAALQFGAEHQIDSGLYLGLWSSQVDFNDPDDPTDQELDIYVGYRWQYNKKIHFDAGMISYRYFDNLTDATFNYNEIYLAINQDETYNYKLSCSSDYPDTAGKTLNHCIIEFIYITPELFSDIDAQIMLDYSHSFSNQNNPWGTKHGYLHTGLFLSKSFENISLTWSVESLWFSDIKNDSDVSSTLSLSYEF